jgi:hypothetical protein
MFVRTPEPGGRRSSQLIGGGRYEADYNTSEPDADNVQVDRARIFVATDALDDYEARF